jgi:citrate synthase
MNIQVTKSGLDGVPAAETVLSHVDGERGELIIAGEHVGRLAAKSSFEGVTARLWNGASKTTLTEANVRSSLGAARERAFARLSELLPATQGMGIVDGFRAAVAGLRAEPGLEHEATIVGAFPVIAGALVRRAKGLDLIAPDPNVSHAADTLRMLHGRVPAAREGTALDAYLVTASDHGMNASTFTARVVASTGADVAAALSAAVGALSGPLHGGAPSRVLKMLDDVAEMGDADRYVKDMLDRGERLMGFGHRVYRAEDPRARVLRRTAHEIDAPRVEVAEALEKAALAELKARRPDRVLATNVEFWSAVVLDFADIPPELFTPMFTCARTAGWSAHIIEQKREGRLIRPTAKYVGHPPRPLSDLTS